jgi:hypothetical protein
MLVDIHLEKVEELESKHSSFRNTKYTTKSHTYSNNNIFDVFAADILPVPELNQFDLVNLAMKKVQLKR